MGHEEAAVEGEERTEERMEGAAYGDDGGGRSKAIGGSTYSLKHKDVNGYSPELSLFLLGCQSQVLLYFWLQEVICTLRLMVILARTC